MEGSPWSDRSPSAEGCLVRHLGGGLQRVQVRDEIFLGRDPGKCRIAFEDDVKVSRVHARITKDGADYFLEDLESRNGTLLNGRRVRTRVLLRAGDVLQLGTSKVLFSPTSPNPSPSPAPESKARRDNLAAAREALGLSSHRSPGGHRTGDRLRIVQDLSDRLSHLRSIPILLTDLLDALFQELPISRAAILLRDANGEYVLEEGRTRHGEKGHDLGISRSVMEVALSTGRPLLVPDVSREARYALGPSVEHHNIHSMACIPMIVERDEHCEAVGMLQVATVAGEPALTQDDLELLTVVANVAGVALENSRLYDETQRRVQELEAIHDLERRLAGPDRFEDFLDAVTEVGHLHLEAASSHLFLWEPPRREKGAVSGGHSSLFRSVPERIKGDLSAWLEGQEELRLLRGAPQHPLWAVLEPWCGPECPVSVLVPLRKGETMIGVYALFGDTATAMPPEVLPLARVIGTQIAGAIERRKMQEEGELNRRMATVGRLVSTILHDFKSPLHLILNLAEALEREDLAPPKRREYVRTIEKQIQRCSGMAHELLDYAVGNRNYRFQLVSSQEFLAEIEFLLAQEMNRLGVNLEVRDDYQGMMRLDIDRMQRVIFNLSSNSTRVLKAGDRFRVYCMRAGDEIDLLVQDTGPGIPPEIVGRVFEPFVSGPENLSTGLGLSISRDIVEGHGGTLDVDKGYDEGAGFLITLPVPDEST